MDNNLISQAIRGIAGVNSITETARAAVEYNVHSGQQGEINMMDEPGIVCGKFKCGQKHVKCKKR